MTPRMPSTSYASFFFSDPFSTQPHSTSLFSSLISPLRSRSRLTAPTAYLLTLLPCPTRYISILTYRSPQSLRAGFCLSACCLYIGSFIVFKSNSKLSQRKQKSSGPIPALSFSYTFIVAKALATPSTCGQWITFLWDITYLFADLPSQTYK